MDRNLSQGMAGTDVRTAQGYLNYHLGPPDLLIEDGIFGPVTREHTLAFQRRANLVTDGIIGPLTRAALLAFQKVSVRGTITPKSALNFLLSPSLRNLPDVHKRPEPYRLQPPDWLFPPPRDHDWQIKKWEFEGSNEFDLPWSDSSPAQLSIEATLLRRVDGKDQDMTLGAQVSATPKSDDGKWSGQFYIKKQWEDVIPKQGPISWLNPWIMAYVKTPSKGPVAFGAAGGNETNISLIQNSQKETVLAFVFGLGAGLDLIDLNGPVLTGKPNLMITSGFKITIEKKPDWQGDPPGVTKP